MAAYQTAAIESRCFKVLGRELVPFTLGHHFILAQYESCFAPGFEGQFSFEDLIFSVFVCSHPQEQAARIIETGKFQRKCARWGFKVKLINYICPVDFIESMQIFRQYIQHYSEVPKYWVEEKAQSSQCGAPFFQSLKVRAIEHLGYDDKSVLNVPLNRLILDYLTHLDGQGIIKLMDSRDEAVLASIDSPEMVAKMERARILHERGRK